MITPENKDFVKNVAWFSLFDSELEDIPDPNQPENTARINAQRRNELASFVTFYKGVGKPFYDSLQDEIRKKTYQLVTADPIDCNCKVCLVLQQIQQSFKFLIKAKFLAEQANQGEK